MQWEKQTGDQETLLLSSSFISNDGESHLAVNLSVLIYSVG